MQQWGFKYKMKKMVVCPKWNSQQQNFSTIFLTRHSSGESSNFTKKLKVNQIKQKLLKKCFKKRCKKDQSVRSGVFNFLVFAYPQINYCPKIVPPIKNKQKKYFGWCSPLGYNNNAFSFLISDLFCWIFN